MSKENKIAVDKKVPDQNPLYLSNLYKALTNAIDTNDFKSVWGLSKTITRYHFKKLYE